MRSIARLATIIEQDGGAATAALERLYPLTGQAHVIGFTGPPGAGKSSLVSRLVSRYRSNEQRVAVLAVDPSSPYSGGAALGDRIRMLSFHEDQGVFIRSMAAREHGGGLATATASLIHLFDAVGYDPILVETVGVGQGETEVGELAHTTVVVQSPGAGDDVQAIKAGILEVATIFVVNKGDLGGAAALQHVLEAMLAEGRASGVPPMAWQPPVIRTSATGDEGIDCLTDAIDRHRRHLSVEGRWQAVNARRARAEIQARVQDRVSRVVRESLSRAAADVIWATAERELSPHDAVVSALAKLGIPATH